MSIEEQRRKAFESWWQIMRPQTSRSWAWNAWNAALDSVVIDVSWCVLPNDYMQAINETGLKVKP